MCGIVGTASASGVDERAWLTLGCDRLHHRGPDGQGQWWSSDGTVGLGHRRLAILDLSEAGSQPMIGPRGNTSIVFNGEIYNFQDLRSELEAKGARFRSQSDTEVVLAAYDAWGERFLERLNGMFALALYDRERGTLLLARDRAGEKPLFYALEGRRLRFASELKALMADPGSSWKVDPEGLDCYLSMGFVPGGRAILAGVNKLPPAHALCLDLRTWQARIWSYWQVPEFEGTSLGEDELLERLEALLADAVRRQLVADVPVGVLLSGGVDSSLVTAMAARAKHRIQTYTIRFPDSPNHDETRHARLIADHFGTDHSEHVAEPSTVDILPTLARQFDEPVNDSSMIPTYLVCRMIRQHCTVALGGDGGDELFGGYSHYGRLMDLQRRARGFPLWLRRAVAAPAVGVLPLGFKGRNWIAAMGTDLENQVPLIASYFDRGSRRRLLSADSAALGSAERILREMGTGGRDLLERATRMDFATYLPEDILVKVDRAAMLNSLEVRAPMLDHRLVEFAFRQVPSHLKSTHAEKKVLLKRLAAKVLPASFDLKRKQGFSIPMSQWLESGPWLGFFREVLLDPSQTLFDQKVVQALFRSQAKGYTNGERLFGLVLFELWRRAYGIQS